MKTLQDLNVNNGDTLTFSENDGAPVRGDGMASVDDQGTSSSCVRFSLSKAVVNALFFQHKIDIDQNSIMICLVQEHKDRYNPLAPINPIKYNGTVLYLQDNGNNKTKLHNQKCWWKVIDII